VLCEAVVGMHRACPTVVEVALFYSFAGTLSSLALGRADNRRSASPRRRRTVAERASRAFS
jgi:hypothetical protein